MWPLESITQSKNKKRRKWYSPFFIEYDVSGLTTRKSSAPETRFQSSDCPSLLLNSNIFPPPVRLVPDSSSPYIHRTIDRQIRCCQDYLYNHKTILQEFPIWLKAA